MQRHALADNLATFLRCIELPDAMADWSLTSLQLKLIKTRARVIRHTRAITFQLAKVAGTGAMVRAIVAAIRRVMRVTANHAETGQNRLDSYEASTEKRPQRADSDAAASLVPPKAGQWRDSSRHPGRKMLEPGPAPGNYALQRQVNWEMWVKLAACLSASC